VLWNKKTVWPIDPEKVEYGSVVPRCDPALNRTCVQVRYRGEHLAHCVPVTVFVARSSLALQAGRALRIEYLRVSPRTRRRYAVLFDQLTDWRPVTRKAVARNAGKEQSSSQDWYTIRV